MIAVNYSQALPPWAFLLPLAPCLQWRREPQKRGGTLRLGMEGGSPSDSLDPRTYADSIPISTSLMLWNNLVEVADNGDATGELFESWEVKPGATDWIFNVRKGITFTSGKTLDADDVIYSGIRINRWTASAG